MFICFPSFGPCDSKRGAEGEKAPHQLGVFLARRRFDAGRDINRSGTRKEELLFSSEKLNKIWVLRKVLQPLGPAEAMQLLIDKVGKVDSNDEFLAAMNTLE